MENVNLKSSLDNKRILGVDEVGRGPLAGPVVSAAVILLDGYENAVIKDSKKLSEKQIIRSADIIKKHSIYAIGEATIAEIDNMNILNASMLAMRRAIAQIKLCYDIILIDGNQDPFKAQKRFSHEIEEKDHKESLRNGDISYELIIKGDEQYQSIAAASIVAKDYRDSLMRQLHNQYPHYHFHRNKGYGTKNHIEAIKQYGLSDVHRTSFCAKLSK